MSGSSRRHNGGRSGEHPRGESKAAAARSSMPSLLAALQAQLQCKRCETAAWRAAVGGVLTPGCDHAENGKPHRRYEAGQRSHHTAVRPPRGKQHDACRMDCQSILMSAAEVFAAHRASLAARFCRIDASFLESANPDTPDAIRPDAKSSRHGPRYNHGIRTRRQISSNGATDCGSAADGIAGISVARLLENRKLATSRS